MLYIEPMCPSSIKSCCHYIFSLNIALKNGCILKLGLVICQLEKVEGGIKVTTDKGEVFEADAVMFATGNLVCMLYVVCNISHTR